MAATRQLRLRAIRVRSKYVHENVAITQLSIADICDTFVENNVLIVDAQTVEDLEASTFSFQDVVDCLNDGATIRFAIERFVAIETIRLNRNVSIVAVFEGRIAFVCNARTVFDIRSPYRRPFEKCDGLSAGKRRSISRISLSRSAS